MTYVNWALTSNAMGKKETNFKQTDIGLIPHDWEVTSIEELGPMSKGFGISRAESLTGNIPAVRYGEIYTNHNDYIRSFTSFISVETAKRARRINSGDLLFTASGETKEGIGKCVAFIDDYEAYAGGDIIIVSTTDQDSMFLGYALNSPIAKKQKTNFGQGDTVVHISAHTLGLVQVPLPPLKEQKRIAEVLSHFDEHIDNLVALLEKRKQVKAATMQALLSGTTRLPGFTQPWEEMMLGDLCEFRTGYTPSKSVRTFWKNGTIPWFRMDDIRENGRKLLRAKQYVTEEAVKGGGLFEAGSFILATTATIGEHAWLIADSLANQRFTNLKIRKSLKNTLSAHFFFYYLYIIDEYCKRNTKTGTFAAVDIYDLKAFKVPTPPLKEQEAIASVLSNMDRGIEALEQEIKKYRQMKEGAMEELLTGKVRLV